MSPEESSQALGAMLARVLDHTGDHVVRRAVIVYEYEATDGTSGIGYEGTENVTWVDHVGLLRSGQIAAEAALAADGEDDED